MFLMEIIFQVSRSPAKSIMAAIFGLLDLAT